MDTHTLSNVDNELDVGVVVVVGTARHLLDVCQSSLWLESVESCTYLNVFVCHSDVVCVCSQILRSGHDSELNSALVAKGLVRPSTDGSDLFDGGDTVVCNEDLKLQVSRLKALRPAAGCTHIGDDCVSVVCGDEILDFRRRGLAKLIAADEMGRQVELRGVRRWWFAVHCAIGLWRSSHCIRHGCRKAH